MAMMQQMESNHLQPDKQIDGQLDGQLDRRNRNLWRVFLAGPIIYSIYFIVVWVLSEFGCIAGIGQFDLWGMNPIRLGVVLLTLVAALIIALVGLSTFRRWHRVNEDPEEDDPLFMLLVGAWLNGFFVVITLLSAVPLVLRSVCGWL
jgi:hypothetical protein